MKTKYRNDLETMVKAFGTDCTDDAIIDIGLKLVSEYSEMPIDMIKSWYNKYDLYAFNANLYAAKGRLTTLVNYYREPGQPFLTF